MCDPQKVCEDLARFIRSKHGSYFNLSVAGYPEGHPDVITEVAGGLSALSASEKTRCRVDEQGAVFVCRDAAFAAELAYLKAKCDAGADAIITQMFFDVSTYATFCEQCVAAGILVPVIPGIMLLQAAAGFKKMTGFCKTRVPKALADKVNELEGDDAAVKAYGPSTYFQKKQKKSQLASCVSFTLGGGTPIERERGAKPSQAEREAPSLQVEIPAKEHVLHHRDRETHTQSDAQASSSATRSVRKTQRRSTSFLARKKEDVYVSLLGLVPGAPKTNAPSGLELRACGAPGLHFYTLNLEKTTLGIVGKLGMLDAQRTKKKETKDSATFAAFAFAAFTAASPPRAREPEGCIGDTGTLFLA